MRAQSYLFCFVLEVYTEDEWKKPVVNYLLCKEFAERVIAVPVSTYSESFYHFIIGNCEQFT